MDDLVSTLSGVHAGQKGNDLQDLRVSLSAAFKSQERTLTLISDQVDPNTPTGFPVVPAYPTTHRYAHYPDACHDGPNAPSRARFIVELPASAR